MPKRWLVLALLLLCIFVVCSIAIAEQVSLRMLQPVSGTVVTAPVYFQASLMAPNMDALHSLGISNASVCVHIDDKSVYCEPLSIMTSGDLLVNDVQLGSHTARLVLCSQTATELLVSERIAFTLVEPREFIRQIKELELIQKGQDLLSWARTFQTRDIQEMAAPVALEKRPILHANADPFNSSKNLLVVGVKTSITSRFAYRQAIRETWASKNNLLQGIEVLFIGCRLNTTGSLSSEYLQAIELERQIFGDLLTHELDCEDSYHDLVKKSTEFLHFVSLREQNRRPKYVMIADDDVYMRVNDLAHFLYSRASRRNYYAGQVLAEQFQRPRYPIRDPTHKNFVSKNEYPMSELPPFASGGHYVLSIDCAAFIANNRHDLSGVGTLEDVSVGLWLKAMHVQPQHLAELKNIGTSECDDSILSYVDLSILAIKAIHDNLVSGRRFCHGFNRTTWSQINLLPLKKIKLDRRQQGHNLNTTIHAHLVQPMHGTVVTSPVHFHGRVLVQDAVLRDLVDNDTAVCVELDGLFVMCNLLREGIADVFVENISLTSHSARLVLVSSEYQGNLVDSKTKPIGSSDLIEFTVVDDDEFRRRLADLNRLHEPQNILSWARSQTLERSSAARTVAIDKQFAWLECSHITFHPNKADTKMNKLLLVIGVKTSVVFGFAHRQVIRETWANKTNLPNNVRVIFIGCQPDAGVLTPILHEAIELEKSHFGDLLTHELNCVDRYSQLVKKTTEFLYFVTQAPNQWIPSAPQYVMIADEDAYVNVHDVVATVLCDASMERYYAGQVKAAQFDQVRYPIRNATNKNYLSMEEYPLTQLPPSATGAHYVLSFDLVRFIGMNHLDLRGFGALDDVSIAYWLLAALQVHPEHIPAFKILQADYYGLNDSVISLADLSPTGIREIHANVIHSRPFSHGINRTSWTRLTKSATATTAAQDLQRNFSESSVDYIFTTDVNLDTMTGQLIVSTQTHVSLTLASGSVSYRPSTELFGNYCSRVYQSYQLIRGDDASQQTAFCGQLRQQLVQAHSAVRVNPARLVLWGHNLQTLSGDRQPAIVVYSWRARYSATVLECLFASAFSDQYVLVLNEIEFEAYQNHQQRHSQPLISPDVAVFAVIDGVCGSTWDLECGLTSSTFLHRYGVSNKTLMIMAAGEPWHVDTLDERVLLLSTISTPRDCKRHLYLPVASTSFGERVQESPMALLRPQSHPIGADESRRFCVYLYARCDRPQREYMFDLLNAIEPVDALGVCQGARHAPDPTRRAGRSNPWYNDEAVKIYERYKFVIAFENDQEPGYVTEKLVNAFLAGSIPVYLGHSETVTQIFNSESFIDCGQFRTLRDCAARVKQVHESAQLYAEMRREPPVANVSAFHDAFSWHPDVPSTFLADELAKYLPLVS